MTFAKCDIDKFEVRDEVMAFALAMENTLRKHDGEKDDSWKDMLLGDMIEGLKEELDELTLAALNCDPKEVAEEALDVANFCMFIRTNLRDRDSND